MRLLLPALLLLPLFALTAPAVDSHGIDVPDRDADLPLRGTGQLRWKWIVRIYVGAFYAPPGVAGEALLATPPKRLAFVYRRGFSAEDLRKATDATVFRDVTPAEAERLKPLLVQWNAGYPAVVENDRLTIDHLANGDLVLAVNGAEKARVRDPVFARAMFAIWLGPKAIDDGFKADLLGQ